MHTSVVEALARVGGVATRATLVGRTSRVDLDRAVAAGDVVRVARGRYALAAVGDARVAAARLGGALCLTSAALQHGWPVKDARGPIHVCVPKAKRVRPVPGVVLHRADLRPDEVLGDATSAEVTLRQSLRQLPFDEALVIADSALRSGVAPSLLDRLVAECRGGPGARQLKRVARLASARPANPFESVTRAIAADVPGLDLRPQVWVNATARADLVDSRLRIVVEADSFTWHGQRDALARDARRYNLMVVDGWIVLRFTWEEVMLRPDEVLAILTGAVALAELQTKRASRRRKAAATGPLVCSCADHS